MNQEEKLHLINEIFTPSTPVENKELFCGRINELGQIKQAIIEKGQHAVMFGPRGAGKTSLANMVQYLFENLLTIKITCHRNDNFKTIWERALRKIRFVNQSIAPGYKPNEKTELYPIIVPEVENINPTEIENILSEIDFNILFIFDEFDIIRSAEVKSQMADMIKLLSDNLSGITLLIVGISQSVDKLIGEHQSIERCIRQIELPLLNEKESMDLIIDNLNILKLSIKNEILTKIIELSSGFPHYIHLLCKYAAYEAIYNKDKDIKQKYFDIAVQKSIDNSDYSIRNAYHKATSSSQGKNQFADVLMACALATTDYENSFSSDEVLEQYNKITGNEQKAESLNYNLGMLCRRERAEILTKMSRRKNARFRFRKPLLKAFVKLKMYEIMNH
jgi:energy-coupling factor transporter ATP-binding protein EcfA2